MADDRPSVAEEVRQKNWGTDELVEYSFVGPEDEGTTEVQMDPGLEERGAEIRETPTGDVLVWEYEGATIAVSNEEFGKWRAEIAVPEEVAKWLTGPGGTEHVAKASFTVGVGDAQEGYIDDVWQDQEATRGHLGENVPPTRLVVYTATNHQPVVALQSLVDDLWEYAEATERQAADMEEAFELAKENEKIEGQECPECGETIDHVVRREGEGPRRCPECEADLEDHIEGV